MRSTDGPRRILFTDLDGTLLDLKTYAWQGAAEAVRRVKAHKIPIVFCSSKTRPEQEVYRRRLGVYDPFIVENGSAVVVPEGYFNFDCPRQRWAPGYRIIELGLPADEVRARLAAIRAESGLPFRGYADMTVQEVSRLTGLSKAAARRAKKREYSETVETAFHPRDWERWLAVLATNSLTCHYGGRLCTVVSAGSDKGVAVSLLRDCFVRAYGATETIAIGDSPNDAPMFRVVDRPFLVQRPGGGWAEVEAPHLEKIAGIGPVGWCEMVSRVLLPMTVGSKNWPNRRLDSWPL